MKLLAHLLADRAAFHDDGTLTLFRAGGNVMVPPGFPTVFSAAVVTRVELSYLEANRLITTELKIQRDGTDILPPRRQPVAARPAEDGPTYINLITQLTCPIDRPGRITIEGTFGPLELPSLHIDVLAVGDGRSA